MASVEEVPRPTEPIVSRRGKNVVKHKDFLEGAINKSMANPYHELKNPEGIVNLGTSVNRLMDEEVAARMMRGDCLNFTANHLQYFNVSGVSQMKEAATNFLTRHLHPLKPIIPENLIVMTGVTSCLDALAHVLCDPDDVIITPTPVYGKIYVDVSDCAQAYIEPLHLTEEEDENGDSFRLNPEDLEAHIESLRESGKKVRAFILLHPHNPLGHVYSPPVLKQLLQICAKHEIHFISDEIYALSVFDENTEFKSILSLDLPDPSRSHFLWGFSKDFGLPGLRIGVLYSFGDEVREVMAPICRYNSAPHICQQAAAVILNDKAWSDEFFLPTKKLRMRKAYQRARDRLQSMGIKVRRSTAGLFLWIGVHAYLKQQTEEEEIKLLYELLEAGLYIVPGTKYYCQYPGWFRLVFTVAPNDLEVGLSRLESVLKKRGEKRTAV